MAWFDERFHGQQKYWRNGFGPTYQNRYNPQHSKHFSGPRFHGYWTHSPSHFRSDYSFPRPHGNDPVLVKGSSENWHLDLNLHVESQFFGSAYEKSMFVQKFHPTCYCGTSIFACRRLLNIHAEANVVSLYMIIPDAFSMEYLNEMISFVFSLVEQTNPGPSSPSSFSFRSSLTTLPIQSLSVLSMAANKYSLKTVKELGDVKCVECPVGFMDNCNEHPGLHSGLIFSEPGPKLEYDLTSLVNDELEGQKEETDDTKNSGTSLMGVVSSITNVDIKIDAQLERTEDEVEGHEEAGAEIDMLESETQRSIQLEEVEDNKCSTLGEEVDEIDVPGESAIEFERDANLCQEERVPFVMSISQLDHSNLPYMESVGVRAVEISSLLVLFIYLILCRTLRKTGQLIDPRKIRSKSHRKTIECHLSSSKKENLAVLEKMFKITETMPHDDVVRTGCWLKS